MTQVTPSGQPATEPESGDVTVTIDPSQSEGIELVQPESEVPLEEAGPVSEAIGSALPDTGVETVDQSLNTFARSVGGMVDSFLSHLPQIIIALIVLVIAAAIASIIARVVRRLAQKLRLKDNLQDLFSKLSYVAVWFFGLIAAAGIVFPGLGMGELVATAGLASIAIGFAFQDIFENFLAGILIIWRFPFNDGDFIEIPSENVMGKVEEVQIRMTHIRSVSGELILVPNATIYKNVVHVLTGKSVRRLTVICGIAYGEDVAEGRQVIKNAVESCESVKKDEPVEIFAQEFASSSINFEVTWWTGPTPLDRRKSRDEVIEKVKSALDEAGIEIPYPYRTLTFSKNEPDIIEAVSGRGSSSNGAKEA